jgi:hypothetical protein
MRDGRRSDFPALKLEKKRPPAAPGRAFLFITP